MSERTIRIGGASGAWGDSPRAVGQLLKARVDYLMMDYLAEVTMSLLARARLKDPSAGYAPDFVDYLKPHLGELAARGIKVVSNAGGVNPLACKAALENLCSEQGIPLQIAVVAGDDLMPQTEALRAAGVKEAVSGEPLPAKLLSANAYLGALPIRRALAQGADIVITGRCVDSALALGVLMHEFGWCEDQYDLLAAGSLAGHLLECGPQSTGGVFTDWESVPDWHNIGYPIAECRADGCFDLTKPEGTGGLVTPATVAEQVLYEVGDPAAYILPDVIADFSRLRLTQAGANVVRVAGALGRPPTTQYKVSATYQDGYRAVALVSIVGTEAAAKARRTADALVARGRAICAEQGLGDFSAIHIETLGAEASYGAQSRCMHAREVILRLVVEHASDKVLRQFARELGSVGLSFAQGTTGLIGGRPKPTPVVRLFTFYLEKNRLDHPSVQVGHGTTFSVDIPPGAAAPEIPPAASTDADPEVDPGPLVEVPLLKVAHARSGDKGDNSNVAIFCRDASYFDHLKRELTSERIAAHFSGQAIGHVERFTVPALHAFNFLIHDALGGGGMASRRIDPQGKAYGQRTLEMLVRVPASWGVH